MAKITFASFVERVNGQMGNVTFRKYKDRTLICRTGDRTGYELTESQAAHNERFRKAINFGKLVMADDSVRVLYEEAAERRELPLFAVCIADYFNAPTIDSVDLSGYKGAMGETIKIIASDDFGVVRVDVILSDNATGAQFESGQAVETPVGSGQWIYTATQQAPVGITVNVQVTAFDRPGGATVQHGIKTL